MHEWECCAKMAKIWDDVDCKVNFCKGDSTREMKGYLVFQRMKSAL